MTETMDYSGAKVVFPWVTRWYKSPVHARRAGRRHARAGQPPVSGYIPWPGAYMDGYRSVTGQVSPKLVRYVSPFGSPAWMTVKDAEFYLAQDALWLFMAEIMAETGCEMLSDHQRQIGPPRIEHRS